MSDAHTRAQVGQRQPCWETNSETERSENNMLNVRFFKVVVLSKVKVQTLIAVA